MQRPIRVIWRWAAGEMTEPDPARLARLWAQTWLAMSDTLRHTGHSTSGGGA
ncbi:hypothetical protein [Alicyclobacillus acidocaldarius]|uniref:hypothetical protein n=1 Tax=Alicyclobacillus acidocaldarius TaxID=405212 RepID=UPI0018728698|nr:hypothetical protein [Alicyclobacillus acidocaldarius]